MRNDAVDQVKAALDIVDTIKKYVDLTKRGQNFVGLCPFHSEKSPSFYVSPQKKIFHCFGCGESGDVLSFIMKHDHMSFNEVMLQQTKALNIAYKTNTNPELADALDNIRAFLSQLHTQYSQWLSNNQNALKYCTNRHMDANDIAHFGLGLAETAQHQTKWLARPDSNAKHAIATRLFNESGYPLLINRLIFPIHNAQGIIVGFSGRDLTNEANAKYINSPESPVFSKKKILYGMHLAKKKVHETKQVIVVEGYVDVIAMAKHGFANTVAVMGTALTDFHANQLSKMCNEVVLMFDSDAAGQNATIKSIPALQQHTLKLKLPNWVKKTPQISFLITHHPIWNSSFMTPITISIIIGTNFKNHLMSMIRTKSQNLLAKYAPFLTVKKIPSSKNFMSINYQMI